MDTGQHQQLRETVARLYRGGEPHNGAAAAVWQRLVGLQLTGIAVDAALGGGGGGLVEAGTVALARGEHGDLGGYPETVGTTAGLAGTGDAAVDELLRGVAVDGRQLAVLRQRASGGTEPCSASPTTGGDVVDKGVPARIAVWHECGAIYWGELTAVAETAPVAMTSRGGEVHARLNGGHQHRYHGADACARWAAVCAAVDTLRCAEIVGACRWLHRDALRYAGQRAQFGKPIAQYQAVQHELATQLSWVDGAELLVLRALTALAAGHGAREAARAGAFVRDKVWTCLFASYNVLGGTGFIEETPINAYCRAILGLLGQLGPVGEAEERSAEFVRPGTWLAPATA